DIAINNSWSSGGGTGCLFNKGEAVCSFDPNESSLPAVRFTTGSRLGFAVDLDAGFVHVHADGKWGNGAPGEGAGYAIAREKMAPIAELEPGNQVQMIFEAAKMKFPVPAGFTPGW